MKREKKENKDHPILFTLKLAILLLVVAQVLAWKSGKDAWTRLHERKGKQ